MREDQLRARECELVLAQQQRLQVGVVEQQPAQRRAGTVGKEIVGQRAVTQVEQLDGGGGTHGHNSGRKHLACKKRGRRALEAHEAQAVQSTAVLERRDDGEEGIHIERRFGTRRGVLALMLTVERARKRWLFVRVQPPAQDAVPLSTNAHRLGGGCCGCLSIIHRRLARAAKAHRRCLTHDGVGGSWWVRSCLVLPCGGVYNVKGLAGRRGHRRNRARAGGQPTRAADGVVRYIKGLAGRRGHRRNRARAGGLPTRAADGIVRCAAHVDQIVFEVADFD